jgi:hypothetical protein
MADEKRVRTSGVMRSACVARFSSGSGQAAALGRPGGVRRKRHEETSALLTLKQDSRN